jgi:hypothetical protein
VKNGVVADIEEWMQEFATALFDDDFAAVIPAMIEVGERTDRGRQLASEFAARRRLAMQLRLQQAIEDGELLDDVDVGAVVSMLVGPLFYRRFISRQLAPPDFVRQLVRSALVPSVVTRSPS